MSCSRSCLILLLVMILPACRVELYVPANGTVATDSGAIFCEGSETCIIEVSDANFDETYTAYPDSGYQFIGWKQKPGALCGKSLMPCHLSTSGFDQHDALMALLESDRVFYLEPGFLESDYIRRHQAGDVAVFEGTLEVFTSGGEALSSSVSVRFEYTDFTFSQSDAPAIEVTRTITLVETGETQVTKTSFRQDDSGTFFDLTDEDGNAYLTAVTSDYGVQSLPSPAEPLGNAVIDYYIMYGGNVSGPIIQGTRSVERFEFDATEPEVGHYPAYRVLITDNYEYLFTYADNKRGKEVVDQSELWVSPAKGVVKSQQNIREYSSNGLLEREQILSLEIVRTNY
mgnify:FL=1